jgi:ABC-type lipoprotein release transport system permease subunit
MVQAAIKSALEKRNIVENCNDVDQQSFCLRSPERNNFEATLREHTKVAKGANFFIILLLTLIGAGAGGLQVEMILRRWRDIGVLHAVGFSLRQILYCYIVELSLVLIAGVAFAAIFAVVMPAGLTGSPASLAWAAAIAIVVAGLAAFPLLLWPLMRAPADVIRESA